MTFEDYLNSELSKPVGYDCYDPDGNSERAVVVRGLRLEILKHYKKYPERIKSELGEFDGFSTPIGWFIGIPLIIILAPILPIISGCHWHKKSIKSYRISYEESLCDRADDSIEKR